MVAKPIIKFLFFLTDTLLRKVTKPSQGARNGILLVIDFLRIRIMTEPSSFKDYTYQYSTKTRRTEKLSRRMSPSTKISQFRGATQRM